MIPDWERFSAIKRFSSDNSYLDRLRKCIEEWVAELLYGQSANEGAPSRRTTSRRWMFGECPDSRL